MDGKLTAEQYNYQTFSLASHGLLDNWDGSPAVGKVGPDFSLWQQGTDNSTTLHELCREHKFLVVEFGSIT